MLRQLTCLIVLAGLLAGCGAPQPEPNNRAQVLARNGAKVIDVRTPAEFRAGHVEGAINIPVDKVVERISEVTTNKSEPLLVHCQSGGRSARATAMLKAEGYTNVVDLGSLQNAHAVTGR